MKKLHQKIEREDFPMFPIENIFICLKEMSSEAWCGIICSEKLGTVQRYKESIWEMLPFA